MDGNIDKVREALQAGLRLAHAYEDWDAEKEISEAILILFREPWKEKGDKL